MKLLALTHNEPKHILRICILNYGFCLVIFFLNLRGDYCIPILSSEFVFSFTFKGVNVCELMITHECQIITQANEN